MEEGRLDGPVFANLGKIHLLARTPQIALNPAEIARQLFFVRAHDSQQLRAGQRRPCFDMRASHKTQTDDGDSHEASILARKYQQYHTFTDGHGRTLSRTT